MREVISKIQTMRKETDFEVTDRIAVTYRTDSNALKQAIAKYRREIMDKVLATTMEEGQAEREWDVNGEKMRISIARRGA